MSWYKWEGKILKVGGRIAVSEDCCCGTGPCCGKNLPTDAFGTPSADPKHPTTLTATFTNTSDCACVDGMVVTLTWSAIGQYWEGPGDAAESCSLSSGETFTLSCGEFDRTDCRSFKFTFSGGSCILNSGDQPLSNCTCDPIHLEYDMSVSGLGCCDSMDGSGVIHVEIDE